MTLLLLVSAPAVACEGDDPPPRLALRCQFDEPPTDPGMVELVPAFTHVDLSGELGHRLIELHPSPFTAGEWYLLRQRGQVLRFHEDPAVQEGFDVVFDIVGDPRLFIGGEEPGVVSMAFHPSGNFVFMVYTGPPQDGQSHLVSKLSRFDVRADGSIDEDSERVFLELPQPNPGHNGNQVAFAPSGELFHAVGDSGLPADGAGHGQDPHSLYAAVLRLNVDVPDTERGTPYSIPIDNPFADGQDGAPEVYAYGLRNPWRLSIDGATGEIWVGDVGDAGWEEVNRIVAGGNYGWSVKEGPSCYRAETCDAQGLIEPVVAYPHADGISITGGHVYRGGDIPALKGRYVYGDYIRGTIWSVDAEADAGGGAEARVEAQAPFWISSFARSRDGELYVVNFTFGDTDRPAEGKGGLYRLAAASPGPDRHFPARLSETGCVTMSDPAEAAPGLSRYAPRSPLWSDAAEKDRFVALPEQGLIELEADGDLALPVGSVLVKNFSFGERIHETRLLIHHAVGWRGYSYRWNEAQTEAQLLEAGLNEVLAGGQLWRYPARAQCLDCHTTAAGRSLSVELVQLGLTDAGGDTVVGQWHAAGRFGGDVTREQLAAWEPLPTPFGDEPLASRARAYLHSNCSGCHRPGGPTRAGMDLRFQTALPEMGVCDVEPELGTLDAAEPDRRLVVPGSARDSVLLLRMATEGPYRMPPAGTSVVHEEGTSLIADWIDSLADCS